MPSIPDVDIPQSSSACSPVLILLLQPLLLFWIPQKLSYVAFFGGGIASIETNVFLLEGSILIEGLRVTRIDFP